MQTAFIFGGDTGETQESIKRKREIAAHLIANQRTARSLPEGLHVLGNAIRARRLNKEADAAHQKGTQGALDAFGTVFGGGGASGPQQAIASVLRGNTEASPQPASTGSLGSFNDALAQSESGGRTDVVNSEGFTGKYQFGQPRLDDFNRATGTNYTTAQLRQNPELQETVQNWHIGDIDSFVNQNGLDRFIGQDIGGTTLSQNSLRAVAHLGGKGGLKKYLETNGQYDPSDSNGTHLSNYAAKFSGIGQPQQVAQARPNTGDRQNQLLRLLENPFLPRAHQQHVLGELQRLQQANDPLRQLQIQKLQKEVDAKPERKIIKGADGHAYFQDTGERVLPNVQAPEPNQPTSVQEYEFAKENGFEGSFVEFQNAKRGAGITITNPDGTVTQIGGAQKPATESQSKANIFASRLESSNSILNDLEAEGTSIAGAIASGVPFAGNFLQTPEFRRYDQAQRDFLNAVLRQESGAVISPAEFENGKKQYFPQPGDDPATIQQKRVNREIAVRSIRQASGPFQGQPQNTNEALPDLKNMSNEELEALINGQ